MHWQLSLVAIHWLLAKFTVFWWVISSYMAINGFRLRFHLHLLDILEEYRLLSARIESAFSLQLIVACWCETLVSMHLHTSKSHSCGLIRFF